MRAKLERTTKKEREILEFRVLDLIEERQYNMDRDIKYIKDEFKNIRKVTALKYNTRNIFNELGIINLLAAYYNAISDRDNFHAKNESYYKILKTLGV